jgi:threonine dehydratase
MLDEHEEGAERRAVRMPSLRDVLRARRLLSAYLQPTALTAYPSLDALLGCHLLIKHENHQPVGAFKVRGGIFLMSQLSADERNQGVIAASTGNHGQSVAWAARLFGIPAVIGVPSGANPDKVEAIRNLGARVIAEGRDYEECRLYVEALAQREGYRYVHSGNEPLLIAGVGTIALEILETDPDIDTLIVPIGGGSGAAGACIVAKAIDPSIQVIGVQAEAAPSVYLSWARGAPMTTESSATFAEGLATRSTFDLPLAILSELLDDFVLVSEEELRAAIRLLLEKTHNLAEGAGAASVAAAVKLRDRLAGRRVAAVMSGGNLSLDQLRWVLGEG